MQCQPNDTGWNHQSDSLQRDQHGGSDWNWGDPDLQAVDTLFLEFDKPNHRQHDNRLQCRRNHGNGRTATANQHTQSTRHSKSPSKRNHHCFDCGGYSVSLRRSKGASRSRLVLFILAPESGKHGSYGHWAVFAADDDDAGFGYVPSAGAVSVEIVADGGAFRNADIFVEDGAADLGVAANVAVIHDDASFDHSAGVNADTASENGFAHQASGEDASTGDDAVEGLAATIGLVENKFGGRIGIAGAAYGPLAIVEIEFGLDVVQVHVGFVKGVDGADVAPVRSDVFNLARNAVSLEVIGEDGSGASEFGQDVAAEIVMAVRIFGVGLEQIEQRARGEDVVAHGGVDAIEIAGHGGGVVALFVKSEDASVVIGFDNAEFRGELAGEGIGGDGDFGAASHVEIDHAADIHAVDVIASEDGHNVRVGLLDEIDVLKNGVGSSLIPGFVLGAHLRGDVDDEVALEQAAELPSLAEVLEQRLAAELGEDIDRVDSGIDEIAKDEIDDAIFAAERDGRLGTLAGKRKKTGSLTSGEDDAQHAQM